MDTTITTAEDVLASLSRVIDPAYGVDIVNLGLVYGVAVDHDRAMVQLTLTSRGSPSREAIVAGIEDTVRRRHPDLAAVDVELVWEPAWRDDFITGEGMRQLDAPIRVAGSTAIPTPKDVLESLHLVIDPEIGVNIVDLGLVYDVSVSGRAAHVVMTLTTPGCPLHASIEAAVERVLETRHPALDAVSLELVWEPPWETDRITPAGRRQLGW